MSSNPDKGFETEAKPAHNKTLDVYLDIDSSVKRWTENSVLPHRKHWNRNISDRKDLSSIYCEVLTNGNCHECQTSRKKLTSINSSVEKFPELETGGYLLFQGSSERHRIPERTTHSALSIASAPAAPDSGYSSWSANSANGSLQRRVRAASAIVSDLNRKSIGSLRLNSQARPTTSKAVRFADGISRQHAWSASSSTRKISPMSQEGWSEKQIEAWKLLAPTPPQIEVSQMNVSMYTPKELPGIKIFDESLFMI